MPITGGNSGSFLGELSEGFYQTLKNILDACPDEVFLLPDVATELAAARIKATPEENFRIHPLVEGENVIKNAIEHNLNGLKARSSLMRTLVLTMPLRSIGYVQKRMKSMKVLSIGPRTEAEIFMLTAAGFDPANITAVDLISYSPLIELGDMHDLPYEDDSFDVIVMGWVLAYSHNPKKAIQEALRVGKSNCIYAIACECTPYTKEELSERGSLVADEGGIYRSTEDIFDLFDGEVGHIWFNHSTHPDDIDQADSAMAIFQRKQY
ncbi:MAG: class I SAM-dependent methyltransferase [Alphaproteobacteria bacterium]|nr:class I SAM-dependent methyltransferase [Alphaproteobacteria bacterium]